MPEADIRLPVVVHADLAADALKVVAEGNVELAED
jgi:hypothetical protein